LPVTRVVLPGTVVLGRCCISHYSVAASPSGPIPLVAELDAAYADEGLLSDAYSIIDLTAFDTRSRVCPRRSACSTC
jgi:hypothetical protein